MYDYINKLLKESPAEIGMATTPTSNHLFHTNPEFNKLSEE